MGFPEYLFEFHRNSYRKKYLGSPWHGFIQKMTTTLVQNCDCKLFIWYTVIERSPLSLDLCKS